jgi:mono/diheme cytochrome c family protein
VKYIAFGIALLASIAIACGGGQGNSTANNAANTNRVNSSQPPASPLPSATIDELASGKKVYEQNCAACHKGDGTGGPIEIEGKKLNPDDLTSDKIKKMTDEKILGYVMNGVVDEGMPAFKDKLSEGEMRDVVKYVRTQIQKMPATPAPPKS